MRLYHRTNLIFRSFVFALISTVLWGCSTAIATQELISVTVRADNNVYKVRLTPGSTVQQALDSPGIILAEIDRVEPGASVILTDGAQVKVTRITEELYTEQVTIPFESVEMKNEALPEGERKLSQAGENGLLEITYRRLYEDGIEVSTSVVKKTILQEPVTEIEMTGSRTMTAAIALPGKLAYLAAGNAWLMENTTADRSLVVSTGDLDGRIFTLSQDGRYLLFTRFSAAPNIINTLWLADLDRNPVFITDLHVENIVHFAGFNPAATRIAFSTAEWQAGSPGWQANNDLYEIKVNPDGTLDAPTLDLASSSGGVYGWWGTDYAWSPDGLNFLYSHPAELGIFDPQAETETPLAEITPYQTGGNWAWNPQAAWSPDGNTVYAVNHVVPETGSAGNMEQFNLIAIPLDGDAPVDLVRDVGMFAYPISSPAFQEGVDPQALPGESADFGSSTVAYLQALQPGQSENSTYRLYTIDRDGSNQKALFPGENSNGITPQQVAWSPSGIDEAGNFGIALVYNGNIWIIDAGSGIAQQITGDGLTTRIDWR